MTDTQTQIANFIHLASENIALSQQVAAVATAQIAAVGQGYLSRITNGEVTFYVDAIAGNDAQGNGSTNAPFKTLQKALDQTPKGAICNAILRTDYSVLFADIVVDGRLLLIFSEGIAKKQLYFAKTSASAGAQTLRKMFSFKLRNRAAVAFFGVAVNMPAVDGAEAGWVAHDNACIVKTDDAQVLGDHSITFIGCDITLPAVPFAALIASITPVPMVLNWYNNALPGATTSPLGYIFSGQTNTAGTATSSLPWFRSVLANV